MKVLSTILFTFSWLTAATQTVYYISSSGKDSNNGLSARRPWKTLTKVIPGSTYLFKRGDTIFSDVPKAVKSNDEVNTVISAYGTGEKPVLCLYKDLKPEKWETSSDSIWRINIIDSENFSGPKALQSNVGFLKVEGAIYGAKKPSIDEIKSDWDFFSDDTYLYVRMSKKTPRNYKKISAACDGIGITLTKNMAVSDLKIIGSGGHAVKGTNVKNVSLTNLDISEIGGAFLNGYNKGTTRYGNGIEFYNGCQNCEVKNCTINGVYDVAFTMQGDNEDILFSNVIFQGNVVSNNEQSFEIWVKGNGPGFVNCKFVENQCSNAGLGWAANYHPNKSRGVHLLSYLLQCQNTDILIKSNVFVNARSGLYSFVGGSNFPKFQSVNNKISLPASVPVISGNSPKRSKLSAQSSPFDDFVSSTGLEKGSVFSVINEQ